MRRPLALTFFSILAGTTASSIAADWKALQGTYAVTAKYYLDPSGSEPDDSHFRLQLSGDAARDLYRAIKAPEFLDQCTGAAAKKVGEMQCLYYKGEKKYTCDFSIDVMRQKIEFGVAC